MKKIEKLTSEQEQRLVEFREEWRAIGLCCDPADFEAGDEVICGFYARLNKPAPIILHFSSPAMCEMAVNFVFTDLKDERIGQIGSHLRSQIDSQIYRQIRSQLDSHLDSHLDSQLGSQIRSQLRSQLGSHLDSQLGSQIRSQLRSQLGSQLGSQLDSQLDSQLGSQIRSQLRSQLDSQLYRQLGSQIDSQLYSQLGKLKSYFLTNRWGAQHWCSWDAVYLFGHEIGVRYDPGDIALLLEWARLAKSVGWWAPWDGICFVSDRPREVHFDAERRLHSEAGMAVRYSDGWGVHAWHGTRVPSEWIEQKADIKASTILTWENIEQRRAGCEILGWHRILHELNAVTIDRDSDPHVGELVEVEIPEIGKEKFLRVLCGTGREFALPVPPEMTTALQAQSWTWGIDQSDFRKPEIRT